jgi:hypothetical protein
LNIQQIITEADILVPNDVQTADKAVALTGINQDFFNVVKIPKIARFVTGAAQGDYILASDVRQKNIDLVMTGMFRYMSLDNDAATPRQNAYSFDDISHTLSLWPAPYGMLEGFLRYRRIGMATYSADNLTTTPEAPEEYHWSYVLALAAYLGNTQDDAIKAANYEAQYKASWNVAAQNYQAGDTK